MIKSSNTIAPRPTSPISPIHKTKSPPSLKRRNTAIDETVSKVEKEDEEFIKSAIIHKNSSLLYKHVVSPGSLEEEKERQLYFERTMKHRRFSSLLAVISGFICVIVSLIWGQLFYEIRAMDSGKYTSLLTNTYCHSQLINIVILN